MEEPHGATGLVVPCCEQLAERITVTLSLSTDQNEKLRALLRDLSREQLLHTQPSCEQSSERQAVAESFHSHSQLPQPCDKATVPLSPLLQQQNPSDTLQALIHAQRLEEEAELVVMEARIHAARVASLCAILPPTLIRWTSLRFSMRLVSRCGAPFEVIQPSLSV